MLNLNIKNIIRTYRPVNAKCKTIITTEEIVKNVLSAIIIGDIAGSKYEFGHLPLSEKLAKTVNLLADGHHYTDDSVMSVAIYEATNECIKKKYNESRAVQEYAVQMKKYAKLYPDVGYGGAFYRWAVLDEESTAYHSFGDGSAMRSGVIGAIFRKVDDVIKYAALSALPTHSHSEGIKGAVVTAVLVWMSLAGYKKEEMKGYVKSHYPKVPEQGRYFNQVYPELTINELLIPHRYQTAKVDCMTAVPLAFINFYESDSYESCLRNCLRYESDADTVMAISGGFAYGYYRNNFFQECEFKNILNAFLDERLKKIV